jgi:hypothetical protein
VGKNSVYISFIFLTLFLASVAYAHAASLKTDTNSIHATLPTAEKIDSYKSNSDFDYETTVVPSESFAERILDWLAQMLNKLFSNEGAAPYIRYAIIAGLIIFVVLRLMNVKAQSLFFKNRKQQSMLINQEEIELMESDLDEMIRKEISDKNFHLAVRYLYLKLLKTLNTKEYINLQVHKTNFDFQYEMKDNPCIEDFTKLSRVFEFVWYGDFAVEKEIFEKIFSDFTSIFKKLND